MLLHLEMSGVLKLLLPVVLGQPDHRPYPLNDFSALHPLQLAALAAAFPAASAAMPQSGGLDAATLAALSGLLPPPTSSMGNGTPHHDAAITVGFLSSRRISSTSNDCSVSNLWLAPKTAAPGPTLDEGRPQGTGKP